MNTNSNDVMLHPQLLDALFAFKNKVSPIFGEVLGLYEIDHISVTRVNPNNQLITLSSTPAMEFDVFNSPLWQYDKAYTPLWFNLCTQSHWQELYSQARYDELYYLKQIKHDYPLGVTLATKMDEDYLIYSLASHKSTDQTRAVFAEHQNEFYTIGQYCSSRLSPILNSCDELAAQVLPQSNIKINHNNSHLI